LERLPCANPLSSRKHAFPRFHFQAQALHPVAAEPEAARPWHNPKTSVPGTCSDGTGEARRTSYRPAAPGPCPFCSFSMLSGSNSLEALGRCNVTPSPDAAERPMHQHNTNHWGAVRPNMIPGKIRVPTLIVHAKWDPSRTMTLPCSAPNVGQLKNISSERMIVLRRNSRRRWRGTGCSCSAR
jgi:hypothetical protein